MSKKKLDLELCAHDVRRLDHLAKIYWDMHRPDNKEERIAIRPTSIDGQALWSHLSVISVHPKTAIRIVYEEGERIANGLIEMGFSNKSFSAILDEYADS